MNANPNATNESVSLLTSAYERLVSARERWEQTGEGYAEYEAAENEYRKIKASMTAEVEGV